MAAHGASSRLVLFLLRDGRRLPRMVSGGPALTGRKGGCRGQGGDLWRDHDAAVAARVPALRAGALASTWSTAAARPTWPCRWPTSACRWILSRACPRTTWARPACAFCASTAWAWTRSSAAASAWASTSWRWAPCSAAARWSTTAPTRPSPRSSPAWSTGRPSLPTPTGSTGPASPRPSPRARPRSAWKRVQAAKEMGLTVSCDLNYRSKLWKWGKKAGEVMPELVALLRRRHRQRRGRRQVFGIKAPDTDVTAGQGGGGQVPLRVRGAERALPQPEDDRHHPARLASRPATTPGRACCGTAAASTSAPTFDITHIVDRVGGGDAFMGGLIYGLLHLWRRQAEGAQLCRGRLVPQAHRSLAISTWSRWTKSRS